MRHDLLVCAVHACAVQSCNNGLDGFHTWFGERLPNGRIRTATAFQVHPDVSTAADALDALLKTDYNQGKTAEQVIAAYAPVSDENNTAACKGRFARRLVQPVARCVFNASPCVLSRIV